MKQSEQMKEIEQRLDAQEQLLREILLCLKGSQTMNIEGVLPAQKRIEEKLTEEINRLTEWQDSVQKYIDIISSKSFRKFIVYVILTFVMILVWVKFGWVWVVDLVKKLVF